jgi:hypothetical protein
VIVSSVATRRQCAAHELHCRLSEDDTVAQCTLGQNAGMKECEQTCSLVTCGRREMFCEGFNDSEVSDNHEKT